MLLYASRGLTVEMTADTLHIAFETVRSHIAAARLKLRAKNVTEACCDAIRHGLID